MKAIFKGKCQNGLLLINDQDGYKKYRQAMDGHDMICTFEPEINLPLKKRMYAYLHSVILDCAIRGYTDVGYNGLDEVSVMYKLKAFFAKGMIIGPDGAEEPYLLELKNMTVERLYKFLMDCILHIEIDLNQEVPDSSEYKAMKLTGKNYTSVKNLK